MRFVAPIRACRFFNFGEGFSNQDISQAEFHCCPAVSRNYGGKTKEIIIIIIIFPKTEGGNFTRRMWLNDVMKILRWLNKKDNNENINNPITSITLGQVFFIKIFHKTDGN